MANPDHRLTNIAVAKGELLGLAVTPGLGLGVATAASRATVPATTSELVAAVVAELDAFEPRWVWWDRDTPDQLARLGITLDRCWDVLTVHRLINGGWRATTGEVWATLNGLSIDGVPHLGQLDLLDTPIDDGPSAEDPVQPNGHLRPEWTDGQWAASLPRLSSWASLAVDVAGKQHELLSTRALSTARSESAAELLCAELAHDGLPIDHAEAIRIIGESAGPRPMTVTEENRTRADRDRVVLQHLSAPQPVNLRNPAEVKAMLRREGLDVETTRAGHLDQLRDEHPIVNALLDWRKDERIATTYGYRWLDEHVNGGRLRGDWSSSDGASGRMTASAGLHNLPIEMRSAISADDSFRFVRADLGQIEPRVLATVSGDDAFIAATQADDLYATVATELGVTRDIAKLAVLGAMYGATTGQSAHVLPRLRASYPVAMRLLDDAAEEGRQRRPVTTSGGRQIRTDYGHATDGDLDHARSAAESRGRFARNAIVQGAAAEFFKVWAILVRRRARPLGASVVLCLHDELLVHTPAAVADQVAQVVVDALGEAAYHWSPNPEVRFVADVSVIDRWSEAKD